MANHSVSTDRGGRAKAILFLCIAAVLWSTGGLLIKWVPWHPIAIAGIRSGIAGVILLLFWVARYKSLPPRPSKFKLLAAANYVCLVMLFVASNKLTTSANAILLQFTAPAWVLLLAFWLLKEKIKPRDLAVVGVVFIGMMLFFIGDLNAGGMLGNVLAVISGVSMALMIITLKKIKDGNPLEIILWGNILTFIAGMPFYGQITLTPESMMGIGFLGVFQLGLSYIFYTAAIPKVSALEAILIPVLEPLLNPVWVLLGTGERPSSFAIMGGGLVIAAVLYRSIREQYEDKQTTPIEES